MNTAHTRMTDAFEKEYDFPHSMVVHDLRRMEDDMIDELRTLGRVVERILAQYDDPDRSAMDLYSMIRRDLTGSFAPQDQLAHHTQRIAIHAAQFVQILGYSTKKTEVEA